MNTVTPLLVNQPDRTLFSFDQSKPLLHEYGYTPYD